MLPLVDMDLSFSRLLNDYFNRAGLSYQKAAQACWVDVAYLHRLVSGSKKNPSRDIVLRLSVGLGLNVAETDELLMAAGHAPLLRDKFAQTLAMVHPGNAFIRVIRRQPPVFRVFMTQFRCG